VPNEEAFGTGERILTRLVTDRLEVERVVPDVNGGVVLDLMERAPRAGASRRRRASVLCENDGSVVAYLMPAERGPSESVDLEEAGLDAMLRRIRDFLGL